MKNVVTNPDTHVQWEYLICDKGQFQFSEERMDTVNDIGTSSHLFGRK